MRITGTRLGRRRERPLSVSRIDRRKTRANALEKLLEDSDEGSFTSKSSCTSESELSYQESDDDESSDSVQPPRHEKVGEETDEEKCAISHRMRKRSLSILNDTSDSSDSEVGDEPVRKAAQKKRLKLSDSEGESVKEKEQNSKAREAAAKRRERNSKLMELLKKKKNPRSLRRRRTTGSEEEATEVKEGNAEDKVETEDSEDVSSVEDNSYLIDSSEAEKQADSDSLKDFIVEDEEQKEEEKEDEVEERQDKDFLFHLPRQFITGSQLTHFQVVVKALMINALDTSFLKSLYAGERKKRYAQEMKSSLHHFDERLVLPRLENLMQRSRWKERYKERVECYPKVRVVMVNVVSKSCEACELHRHGRYSVCLSGQLYHSNTLQEDQFMPDDSQRFFVGSVCANRTMVYHALKHFKYHLFERCRTALEDQKEEEEQMQEADKNEPVKDTVNKVFEKLQQEGWITKQYDEFQEHLNAADFFQEEKLG